MPTTGARIGFRGPVKGAVTKTVVVKLSPSMVMVIVVVPSLRGVTGMTTERAPAGIITETGTVATKGFELIKKAVVGVFTDWSRVTVNVPVPPVVIATAPGTVNGNV